MPTVSATSNQGESLGLLRPPLQETECPDLAFRIFQLPTQTIRVEVAQTAKHEMWRQAPSDSPETVNHPTPFYGLYDGKTPTNLCCRVSENGRR